MRRRKRPWLPRRKAPLRKSLLARLMATSVLVAVCSIGATAWLAVQTTTRAIQQERGQVLADDASVYNELVEYAAVHRDWDAVGPIVRDLAERTGRRIVLTSKSHRPIADSAASAAPSPLTVSAVIDPLHTDAGLLPGSGAPADDSGIDPRATGPYLLPSGERSLLRQLADKRVDCLRNQRVNAQRIDSPSGRPIVKFDPSRLETPDPCFFPLDEPTATEREPLARLNTMVSSCLAARKPDLPVPAHQAVQVGPDFSWVSKLPPDEYADVLEDCTTEGRRTQLRTYVAPAALLYLSTPGGADTPQFDLSAENTNRIIGVTGLVLVLTVGVTAVIASRLVRPLRALTDAARNQSGPHRRVPVITRDEIGYLTEAFNEMSERRERLEEQRKVMVSDVAHELRTPLTNIRSWLEAAQDGVATPNPALVSSLLEEALLLQHIIDDLQDLAAADADKLRIHPEVVRLSDVLHHVAAAHRAAADTAEIRLTVSGEDGIHLTADPVRLRQAIGNLVSNAVRHTARGGSIGLESRVVGDEVVIEVADTGSGIDPDDLPRLFERFWRAEKSRSRHAGGSGLGLSIVLQLAHAHGGTVTVASTPGVGSVFALRLPRVGSDPRD
ncbi:ATP-binding protein [Streptomyces sp. NPDC002870]|uniref:HAMP domain-containing sensor histidine kinase n=1 Tax=Streptomyces sp. NPDC002870 TaxID=3364666 RepID=UPI0036CB9B3F